MMRRTNGRRARQPRPGDDQPAGPVPAETTGPPQADQWPSPDHYHYASPVVVGEPIVEFEPKPPGPGMYMTDTCYDGWSCEHLTVRLASVRGYFHRYQGIPRQDDAIAAFDPATGAVVAAVADGVSSASHSHLGATIACHSATEATLRQLAAGQGRVDWHEVVRQVAAELYDYGRSMLADPSPSAEAVEELLSTTLVVGYARPAGHGLIAGLAQVGDSTGWVLREDRFHPVLANKIHRGQEVISSAVDPLPRIPASVTANEFPLAPGSVLLIGTDGFGDPLGDGTGKVGELFARHLQEPPPARDFAHLLDFSRETFDDDRTLVAMWPRVPRSGPRE